MVCFDRAPRVRILRLSFSVRRRKARALSRSSALKNPTAVSLADAIGPSSAAAEGGRYFFDGLLPVLRTGLDGGGQLGRRFGRWIASDVSERFQTHGGPVAFGVKLKGPLELMAGGVGSAHRV